MQASANTSIRLCSASNRTFSEASVIFVLMFIFIVISNFGVHLPWAATCGAISCNGSKLHQNSERIKFKSNQYLNSVKWQREKFNFKLIFYDSCFLQTPLTSLSVLFLYVSQHVCRSSWRKLVIYIWVGLQQETH